MHETKKHIGGYEITPVIQQRLASSPDLFIEADQKQYAFVFGKRRTAGDPSASLYCLVRDGNGLSRLSVSGGNNYEYALTGISLTARDVVSDAFRENLRYFEERFGIDFAQSRAIPLGHALEVRAKGYRLAQWLEETERVDAETLHDTRNAVSGLLLLSYKDHKTFGIAAKQERALWLRNQYHFALASDPKRAMEKYYRTIFGLEEEIRHWRNGAIPPGNVIHYLHEDGKSARRVMTFTDWSFGNPYAEWTLEGTIAEEVIHLASRMSESNGSSFTSAQLNSVEELAVKYYAVQALKECGVKDKVVAAYSNKSAQVSGMIQLWTEMVGQMGQETMDRVFFEGHGSFQTWRHIKASIEEGLQRGVIT